MKFPQSAEKVGIDFSLKRCLVRLNRDLDCVELKIRDKSYDRIIYRHSHESWNDQLSNIQIAILLMEDRGFFSHKGFEFRSVARIIRRLFRGCRLGGVSTIDQQIIRIFTQRNERSIRRKVRETFLAYALQFRCAKRDILYAYMHNAYLGYKLEGVEIASQKIFLKPAAMLSIPEACFIACLFARPMPKRVRLAISTSEKEFLPYNIIELSETLEPKWSRAVHSRYQYSLKLYKDNENRRLIR